MCYSQRVDGSDLEFIKSCNRMLAYKLYFYHAHIRNTVLHTISVFVLKLQCCLLNTQAFMTVQSFHMIRVCVYVCVCVCVCDETSCLP
jgi:hypothetical protein